MLRFQAKDYRLTGSSLACNKIAEAEAALAGSSLACRIDSVSLSQSALPGFEMVADSIGEDGWRHWAGSISCWDTIYALQLD